MPSSPHQPDAPTALRPLAVCIDDLGLHAGVNQAAQALALAGRVSSWSCMVDGEAIAEVAAWLANNPHDNLELGLHLNLSEALPGTRWQRPLNSLLLGSHLGALSPATVRAELATDIARQLDAYEQRFGAMPDFIDGHQHVHQLPAVRELLLAELQRRWPVGAARRPWLRRCASPAAAPAGDASGMLPGPERLKPWIIQSLGCAPLSRLAMAAGLQQNKRLLGVRRFEGDSAGFMRLLNAWLARAGAADLLMVHPAAALPGLNDSILAARAVEYAMLAGPEFGAALAHHGLKVQALNRTLAEG
jgi:predicted glycoside hydrolase/deacetylase ChbG (UPF0249 family)